MSPEILAINYPSAEFMAQGNYSVASERFENEIRAYLMQTAKLQIIQAI